MHIKVSQESNKNGNRFVEGHVYMWLNHNTQMHNAGNAILPMREIRKTKAPLVNLHTGDEEICLRAYKTSKVSQDICKTSCHLTITRTG